VFQEKLCSKFADLQENLKQNDKIFIHKEVILTS